MANGVDRDPGATNAAVTPARTHSSVMVAQNVAAAVISISEENHSQSANQGILWPMSLHNVTIGGGPQLVLAHGFTQNLQCWGPLAIDLAQRHEVVLVDAPGHGRSYHDDADLWEAGRLLGAAGSRPQGVGRPGEHRSEAAERSPSVPVGGPATYVGYSMGGRAALHLALSQPELVRRLVLIGATAGLDTQPERQERCDADHVLAQRLLSDGLVAFIDAWLAGPLFATLTPEAACRNERLTNRPAGLAASLEHCGTGRQEPLWHRLHELDMPVLVIAGERDIKFTALGRRMVDSIGDNATLVVQPRANHAVHLEQPTEVSALISAFAGSAAR